MPPRMCHQRLAADVLETAPGLAFARSLAERIRPPRGARGKFFPMKRRRGSQPLNFIDSSLRTAGFHSFAVTGHRKKSHAWGFLKKPSSHSVFARFVLPQ